MDGPEWRGTLDSKSGEVIWFVIKSFYASTYIAVHAKIPHPTRNFTRSVKEPSLPSKTLRK